MALQIDRRQQYHVYFPTSRGGEWIPVSVKEGRAVCELERAIYNTSPLVVDAALLRNLADTLDEIQGRASVDAGLAEQFKSWLMQEAGRDSE